MKKILLIGLVTLFYQSLALAKTSSWNDLEVDHRYFLNRPISFLNIMEFSIGDKFELLDSIVDAGQVLYYQFHFVDCQHPNLEAEMVLINPFPEDTSRDHSVGVQLERDCNLGIFFEPADFYSPSLFAE